MLRRSSDCRRGFGSSSTSTPQDGKKSDLCLMAKHRCEKEKVALAAQVQQLAKELQAGHQTTQAGLNQCDELSEEQKMLTMEKKAL